MKVGNFLITYVNPFKPDPEAWSSVIGYLFLYFVR